MSADVHAPTASNTQVLANETRRLVIAWFLCLALLVGGTLAWILIYRPPHAGWIWGEIVGLASLPGKYLIFTALIHNSPLTPWQVVVLATATDVALALTLAIGLGWIEHFPFFARTLKRVHDRAQEALESFPRLKRMAFWGVVLFVFLPLPASGAFGGTFVARFLGLTRTAGVVAVTLGGVLVSILFATLAVVMGKRAQEIMDNRWVSAVAILVFVVFAWWAWKRIRVALEKR
jgi:uncharacterized membrane protein